MTTVYQRNFTKSIPYGAEVFGKLDQVLVHTPGEEIATVNSMNHKDWDFADTPAPETFIEDHERYCHLLDSHGIELHQLSDYIEDNRSLMSTMPNVTYMHDMAIIGHRGAFLSRMSVPARKLEHKVIKEALLKIGIPVFYEFESMDDSFEGAVFLPQNMLLIVESNRYQRASIAKFVRQAVKEFTEVIYVDVSDDTRFKHPHAIANRVRHDLVMAYLPAFKKTYAFGRGYIDEIDFVDHMRKMEIDVIDISDEEQQRHGCSFLPLKSGVLVQYEDTYTPATLRKLANRDVEVIPFRADSLRRAGGSLISHTLEIYRKPAESFINGYHGNGIGRS